MIGLKKEIESRRTGKQRVSQKQQVSTAYISKIINKTFNATKNKVDKGYFTVKEALDIFKELKFKTKDKFEAFIYLFTEQGE